MGQLARIPASRLACRFDTKRAPRKNRDALLHAVRGVNLALRELEAAARLGSAVLLALDDAGVAGEEAGLLDDGAERGLEAGQRLGDAVLDRAGLAREAAPDDG